MQPKSNAQRGVKTWEVVVVFAIMSVGAAIFLPIFITARNKVGYVPCTSNVNQFRLAFAQYVQDYDGRWPIGIQPTNLSSVYQSTGIGWGGQIYPYIKVRDVFRCPEDPENKSEQQPTPPASAISYAYNSNIATIKGRAFSPKKALITHSNKLGTMVKDMGWSPTVDTSKIVVLFEVSNVVADVTQVDEGAMQGATTFSSAGNGLDGYLFSTSNGRRGPAQYATGYLGGRQPSPAPDQFPTPTGRHEGGSNFLLADGHVKWFKPGQVSSGWDAATASAPQTGTTLGHAAGTADTAHAATFSTR